MTARSAVRRALLALLGSALAVPVGIAAPAHASHGDGGVHASGRCGDGVRWELKAQRDDGRIEVEGEIDSNHTGQTWHWTFKHNGSTSAHGSQQTAGRSGSFEVKRRMSDLAGQDRFAFRATHGTTVCRGTVSR